MRMSGTSCRMPSRARHLRAYVTYYTPCMIERRGPKTYVIAWHIRANKIKRQYMYVVSQWIRFRSLCTRVKIDFDTTLIRSRAKLLLRLLENTTVSLERTSRRPLALRALHPVASSYWFVSCKARQGRHHHHDISFAPFHPFLEYTRFQLHARQRQTHYRLGAEMHHIVLLSLILMLRLATLRLHLVLSVRPKQRPHRKAGLVTALDVVQRGRPKHAISRWKHISFEMMPQI